MFGEQGQVVVETSELHAAGTKRAPDKRDAAAVLFRKRQQHLGEGGPRRLGFFVIRVKPKHGQVGLEIGVKVFVRDLAQQRDLLLGNPLFELLSSVCLSEGEG
jgi:hypothetical protein